MVRSVKPIAPMSLVGRNYPLGCETTSTSGYPASLSAFRVAVKSNV